MFLTNAPTKGRKIAAIAIIAGTVLAVAVLVLFITGTDAYASDGGVFDSLRTGFIDIYKKIGLVVTAVAVVAIGICAFKWVLGTDPQTVHQAKQWLLYILIGLALYWLAFAIVNTVQSIVVNSGIADDLNADPWASTNQ